MILKKILVEINEWYTGFEKRLFSVFSFETVCVNVNCEMNGIQIQWSALC
jgi:hypothetical protein